MPKNSFAKSSASSDSSVERFWFWKIGFEGREGCTICDRLRAGLLLKVTSPSVGLLQRDFEVLTLGPVSSLETKRDRKSHS